MTMTANGLGAPILMLPTLLLLASISPSLGFLPQHSNHHSQTALFGLPEWRNGERYDAIFLLPFAADQTLLPGQKRQIVLKEGRFFDLFQDSIDEHESIVGMALMGEDGILPYMPLCEIEDFQVNSGFRGKITITVSLLAVGRAKLMETTQMKPVMMGTCQELTDDRPSPEDLAIAIELVDNVEGIIQDLSGKDDALRRKERYEKAHELSIETGSQSPSDAPEQERSLKDLTASSWAVFSVVSDTTNSHKAVAMTNLVERLQCGLKMILDEKYQLNAGSYELDNNAGFE